MGGGAEGGGEQQFENIVRMARDRRQADGWCDVGGGGPDVALPPFPLSSSLPPGAPLQLRSRPPLTSLSKPTVPHARAVRSVSEILGIMPLAILYAMFVTNGRVGAAEAPSLAASLGVVLVTVRLMAMVVNLPLVLPFCFAALLLLFEAAIVTSALSSSSPVST